MAEQGAKGVRIVKTEYKGWPNCHRMTNGQIELIATQDIGPRIIRLGFVGGDNVFAEYPDHVGQTGGDEWRIYGGHRLWHAPEAKPRTYWPDNLPIEVQEGSNALTLVQPAEGTTGIQKTIEITMRADRNQVVVVHRLRNDNLWPVELAPWALSVMTQQGLAVIPQPAEVSHEEALLPARPIVQWTYTDMSDPRWRWGTKYITLQQDPTATKPQKIGVGNRENWIAYAVNGDLFVKTFQYRDGATYPDFGCSTEVFTNADMLEVETLGPMTALAPGETVEHVENWFLFKGVVVSNDDEAIDAAVLPKALEALKATDLR
ncbi:MAG: hypothetical protein JSV65_15800 [Armatimonadota bacterium]|nr:MAG: hypothetical protein JSV65_15800 [Armatimonadota bacterium]